MNPGRPAQAELASLAEVLDRLETRDAVSHAELVVAVKDAFGSEPSVLMQDQAFSTAMRRLRDSVLTIKQLPDEHHRPIESLTNQLRDLELIARLARDSAFPAGGAELHDIGAAPYCSR